MKANCVDGEECIGKQIAGFGEATGVVVIRFVDGTCLILESDCECGESDISERHTVRYGLPKLMDALMRAGAIERDEYEKFLATRQAEIAKSRREEYERLKREFEPESPA